MKKRGPAPLQKGNRHGERPFAAGFTLVEIIAVVAIIFILASLVAGASQIARRRALITKARTTVATLEVAIAMYETDMGEYPADDADFTQSNKNLVNALADISGHQGNANWHGPYMEFDRANLSGTIPNATLQDPWNNIYYYDKTPATGNTQSYNLWSAGPGGINNNGSGDDIANW